MINNRYKILKKLGPGGMSDVYKVLDTQTNTRPALKTSPHKHIKNEFLTLSKLRHPNIVKVYDYGVMERNDRVVAAVTGTQHPQQYFFTMEYIEGGNFYNLFRNSLPKTKAEYQLIYSILLQICDALGFVHFHRLVHCDIKPSNILIDFSETGKPRTVITDFGLIEKETARKLKGTLQYIAPEVLRGERIDRGADLYSLGVTVYKILTHHLPFEGNNAITLIKQHTRGEIKPPREYNPAVPRKLNDITLDLLEPKTKRKTKSIDDLLKIFPQISGKPHLPTLFISPLIGRQKELSTLKNTWREVKTGEGRVISIYGENGMGKTRLLQEFKPYAQTEGAVVKEFDSIRGFLKTFTDIIGERSTEGTELNLFDKIATRLLVEAKKSPLLLVVEDLQLQKKPALNLIEYLIRSIESAPILLIITSSDPKLIGVDIQSIEYFKHINLTPLSPRNTATLVKAMLLTGDEIKDIGTLIYAHTEGNPFLITTLTRGLVEKRILEKSEGRWTLSGDKLKTYRVPKDIKDFVIPTLKGLSEYEFELLKIGALLQKNFTRPILKGLIRVKLQTLYNLQEKGVIMENPAGNYSFTHQMVSDVIEKNIPIGESAQLHRKIAGELEYRFQQNLERIAPDLTYHYLRANETAKAYKFALISGEMAKNTLANTEAAEYFECALSLVDKLGGKKKKFVLYETLGDLYHDLSKYRDALTRYESALSLATRDSSTRIYRKIGVVYRDQQKFDKALDYFQKGFEISTKDASQKVLLLSDIGWIHMCLGDFKKSLSHSQKAIKMAEEHDDQFGLSYAHSTLGAAYLHRGDYDTASKYYKEALGIARRMHNENLVSSASYNLGQILWKTGKPREARELYKKSLKIAEKERNSSRIALYHNALGILAQEQGDFDNARKHYTSALTIFKRMGDKRRTAAIHVNLGVVHEEKGDLNAAIRNYDIALSISRQLKDNALTARIYNNLGNLYKETGNLTKAIKNLKEALKIIKRSSNRKDLAFTLHNIGTVHMLQGKMEEALRFLRQSYRFHREQESKKGMAEVCPTLAEYYLLAGNISTAEGYCLKGIKLCEEINDRLHLGITQRVLGTVYSRKGEIDKALSSYALSTETLEGLKAEYECGKTFLVAGEEIFSIRKKIGKKFWREGLLDQTVAGLKRAEQIFKSLNAKADLKRVNSLISKLEKYSPLLLEPIPGQDKRLKALYRTSQIVNSTMEIDKLLERILDLVIEIMGAERGFILLREGKELNPKTARNMDKQSIADMSDFSRTIVENVEKKGELIITANAQAEPRFKDRRSVAKFKLLSIMCVPFRIKDRIVGAIYIDDRRRKDAFTSEDLEFLQAFCDQAAIALENARLMGELKTANKLLELENIDMKDQITHLRTAVEERYSFGNLIGKSKPMQKVYNDLEKIIKYDSPVIIEGETGTGKEIVANIIHYNGPRKDRNFIVVNSSAIPEDLLESELFGHVEGAFTGATQDKQGLFEIADGGTIFFDEIAELDQNLQVKLLRVLQDGELRRVGATKSRKVNVRVMVATNRDLQRQVKRGKFRRDLYYRLNVMSIKLPPLRKRKEDIPLLTAYILRKFRKKLNKDVTGFTPEALYTLQNYHWPGNVRELENVIERAIVMAEDKKITEKDLPKPLTLTKSGGKEEEISFPGALADVEKRYILAALKASDGNKMKAAKILGVSRPALDRKIKKHGL